MARIPDSIVEFRCRQFVDSGARGQRSSQNWRDSDQRTETLGNGTFNCYQHKALIQHYSGDSRRSVPENASASLGDPMLSLLESFLHVRWKPLFEGRTGDD